MEPAGWASRQPNKQGNGTILCYFERSLYAGLDVGLLLI